MKALKRLRSAFGSKTPAATGLRDDPECVVLPAKQGGSDPTRAPVRIFLGTEPAQSRAERVFFYSIERHRDPTREYRIYRMTGLRGFDSAGWRTGFTMYRYAIPEFAGFAGRAIYNDVDQIYTDDPANLFDLPMDGIGYRAISPDDTSVMLIDCERMGPYWNRARAATLGKKQLTGQAEEIAALWGELSGHWNARDTEYRHGVSSLIHFTTLHLQPWQPTLEQYTYHPNPLRELWLALEREADDYGYEVFRADAPSELYQPTASRAAGSLDPEQAMSHLSALSSSLGKDHPSRLAVLGLATPTRRNDLELQPFSLAETEADASLMVPPDTLDRLPVEDMPWALDHLFSTADYFVHLTIRCGDTSDGAIALGRGQSTHWWCQLVRRIAARHNATHWTLRLDGPDGRCLATRHATAPATADQDPPRVWVLYGNRAGDNAQLRNVAEALGWPFEIKQLTFNGLSGLPAWLLGASQAGIRKADSDELAPNWPDIVIASGRRSAPIARWIRRQSGNRCRLVHVGRPWCSVSAFDFVITTPQYQLPLADNVQCNTLPLNRPQEDETELPSDWQEVAGSLPEPCVAALVGGDARPYRFDGDTAAAFGRELNRLVRERGGSALVVAGHRCSETPYQALLDALDVPYAAYHPQRDTRSNPYSAFIARAEYLLVTGDSASMLADACSTGKPVTVQAPAYRPGIRDRGAELITHALTGRTRTPSHRGTPKQQDWRGRLHATLIARGWLTSVRDPSLIHDELVARGLIELIPMPDRETPTRPLPLADELTLTAQAVRQRSLERPGD